MRSRCPLYSKPAAARMGITEWGTAYVAIDLPGDPEAFGGVLRAEDRDGYYIAGRADDMRKLAHEILAACEKADQH